jgi:enterochelin esterase-like enzyme
LIIQTKTGSLHMGPASPDGWNETAHLDLFQDISWTPPSFADGTIFSRSQKEIARLKWRDGSAKTASNAPSAEIPSTSQFGKFLAELQTAQDKKGTIDRYLESQKTFPIIEWPDNIIFVYNGPADDVAISGDLQGSQREEPMHRIPGTDVFYFTTQLEPDARINYRYVKNFDQMIADPKNPNATTDRRGNPLSWVGMPAWKEPSHLKQAPAEKQGRVEKQELPSKIRQGGSTKFEVYLPHDYDRNQDRYPVVYIFDGASALTEGKVTNTLDNVIGNSVQPLIAVFLTEIKTGPQPQEQQIDETKATTELLVKEVVPFVDAHYRTTPDAKSRALMGPLFNGYNALFSALEHPEIFGGVAAQSTWLDTRTESSLKEMIRTAEEQPLRLYLDWGLYDAHSIVEGWDVKRDNRVFDEYLRSRGYRPAGGETHDSYGWASWRNRTDLWLASLFPSNGQK